MSNRRPVERKRVLLTLTAALPPETRKELSRDNTAPWAIELANGEHCTLLRELLRQ